MTKRLPVSLVAYNEETYLSDTIQSVLKQTFQDFTFHIYDHASTDSTGEIADHYATVDPRVEVVHLSVNEPKTIFQRIIADADTPFFMFVAGHDIYDPRYIEVCLQPLSQDPSIVLSYSRATIFSDSQDGVPILGNFNTLGMAPLSRSLVVGYGLVYAYQFYGIYRLAALKQTAPQSVVGNDHVLLAELALFGQFTESQEVLFHMRALGDHGDQDAYKKSIISRKFTMVTFPFCAPREPTCKLPITLLMTSIGTC